MEVYIFQDLKSDSGISEMIMFDFLINFWETNFYGYDL